MIKLKINNIENKYQYTLEDLNKNTYHRTIEFYDLEQNPEPNDTIYMDESLLKEPQPVLSFGPLDGIYGRTIESQNDPDLLILETKNTKQYLKRFYG